MARLHEILYYILIVFGHGCSLATH
uniref:Uncharacterized protein n=1 Tax=Rhizophora mucronata TaxID=61149 RepID=A0A2P2P749_RHIMU